MAGMRSAYLMSTFNEYKIATGFVYYVSAENTEALLFASLSLGHLCAWLRLQNRPPRRVASFSVQTNLSNHNRV